MSVVRTAAATLLLAGCALGVNAQALPQPKEFYFDPDRAASQVEVVAPDSPGLAEALMRERERGRRKAEATAQLAHLAMSEDRTELGRSLYQQAISATHANSSLGRSVRWNYAWDLYRAGEYEAARLRFGQAISSVGGAAWVPPTLALVLWRLGRQAEAVQWYAAAVRTEPLRWGNPANIPGLLPDWRTQDHAVLAEVHAAWNAEPPAWP